MSNDTTVTFHIPAFRDEMTDLIRAHAQTAIRQDLLAELATFLGEREDTDSQGRPNVVRNGYQPGSRSGRKTTRPSVNAVGVGTRWSISGPTGSTSMRVRPSAAACWC